MRPASLSAHAGLRAIPGRPAPRLSQRRLLLGNSVRAREAPPSEKRSGSLSTSSRHSSNASASPTCSSSAADESASVRLVLGAERRAARSLRDPPGLPLDGASVGAADRHEGRRGGASPRPSGRAATSTSKGRLPRASRLARGRQEPPEMKIQNGERIGRLIVL
jgi:hypothetical protein